jgi:hypothetical protein
LTAEQGQSGLGLEAQQASVRAFAKAQGWTLAAEYSDIASGKDDHRPGFQAALVRCRQLGAVLATVRLDRITRRAHTLSKLLEDGYSVRAADMPGADDLMMRIYAAMAQKERELISERTRAALAAAKARGKRLAATGLSANCRARRGSCDPSADRGRGSGSTPVAARAGDTAPQRRQHSPGHGVVADRTLHAYTTRRHMQYAAARPNHIGQRRQFVPSCIR